MDDDKKRPEAPLGLLRGALPSPEEYPSGCELFPPGEAAPRIVGSMFEFLDMIVFDEVEGKGVDFRMYGAVRHIATTDWWTYAILAVIGETPAVLQVITSPGMATERHALINVHVKRAADTDGWQLIGTHLTKGYDDLRATLGLAWGQVRNTLTPTPTDEKGRKALN